MASLNYRHLYYFWAVVREGSIARATKVLNLTQPAISAQLRKLERSLGEELLVKSGRNLVLTETGRMAYRYAEDIFALGRELTENIRGNVTDRPLHLTVGVSNALSKLLTYRLLAPVLELEPSVRLMLRDDRPDRLLADLAVNALDLVLTDAPLTPATNVRAFSHLLGESDVTIFGTPSLAAVARENFPRSMDGMPFLLPTENSTLRRSLEQWFDAEQIQPMGVAEIEDSGLLKVFGEGGAGLFASASAITDEVLSQFGVEVVARAGEIREQFYGISTERRLRHPAVVAISEAARQSFLRSSGS